MKQEAFSLVVSVVYDATRVGNPWQGGIHGYGQIELKDLTRIEVTGAFLEDSGRAAALAAETKKNIATTGRTWGPQPRDVSQSSGSWKPTALSGAREIRIDLPFKEATYYVVLAAKADWYGFRHGWTQLASSGPYAVKVVFPSLKIAGPTEVRAGAPQAVFTLQAQGAGVTAAKGIQWTLSTQNAQGQWGTGSSLDSPGVTPLEFGRGSNRWTMPMLERLLQSSGRPTGDGHRSLSLRLVAGLRHTDGWVRWKSEPFDFRIVSSNAPGVSVASRLPQAEDPEHSADLNWLRSMYDPIERCVSRLAELRMKLGIQRLALAKLRARIQLLRGFQESSQASDAMRRRTEERIRELEEQVADLQKEQLLGIEEITKSFGDIVYELEHKGGRSKFADIRQTAQAMQAYYSKEMELNRLELFLTAGRRDEFTKGAQELISQGKYVDAIRLLQGLDAVEQRDPRTALYAVRMALQANPRNSSARELLKSLEVGYLKAIDAKTLGEGATVRAELAERLAEHGEAGFWGYLKDLFTTGIGTSIEAVGGRPNAEVREAGLIEMTAAAHHGGLLLMTRLREKGLELGEIRKLSNEDFIAKIENLFGRKISAGDALRMRAAMQKAFRNPDVDRLLRPSKQEFDVDRGVSYFATDTFDSHWQDWLGDAVNIKNVLLMVGPSAVVRPAGGLVTTEGLVTGEMAEAVTAKNAFASLIRLPQLTEKLAATKAGQRCLEELLKFNAQAGGLTKFLAEGLLQQGVVEVGAALGGKPGELAAEVITSFGVGDIGLLVEILERQGMKKEAIEGVVKMLQKAARETEAARRPIGTELEKLDKAFRELRDQGKLSQSSELVLRQTKAEVEAKRIALQRVAASELPARMQSHEAEKFKQLQQSIEAAAAGKPAEAKAARDTAEKMELVAAEQSKEAAKKAAIAQLVTKRIDSSPASAARPAQLKPENAAISNSGIEHRGSALAPMSKKDAKVNAEYFGRLDYRSKGDTRVADEAMLRLGYDEAIRGYSELLMREGYDPVYRMQLRDKLEMARLAKGAEARLKQPPDPEVLRPYTPAEINKLASMEMLPLTPSGGGTSLNKPVKIGYYEEVTGQKVFHPLAVFKPCPEKNLKNEVVAERLARKLGLPVPAGTKTTFRVDIEVEEEVAGELRKVKKTVERSGYLSRFVEDKCDLAVMHPSVQWAAKKDVARDRVFSAFLGDADRHDENLIFSGRGAFYSIDHELSNLHDLDLNWEGSAADREKTVATHLQELFVPYPGRKYPETIGSIERQFVFADFEPGIRQIEELSRADVEALLKGVLAEGPETERALEVLLIRQKNLRKAFEHFESILDKVPTTGGPRASVSLEEMGIPLLRTGWAALGPIYSSWTIMLEA